jgi:hypothetical protein
MPLHFLRDSRTEIFSLALRFVSASLHAYVVAYLKGIDSIGVGKAFWERSINVVDMDFGSLLVSFHSHR